MRLDTKRVKKNGFTLLELLIASSVIVLVFAFSMSSLRIGNNAVENARLSTLASQYLQDEAERVRLLNWGAVQGLVANELLTDTSSFKHPDIVDGRIKITRTVSDVAGYTDMKEITLVANWVGLSGVPSTRRMIFRYSKNGAYDYYYGLQAN